VLNDRRTDLFKEFHPRIRTAVEGEYWSLQSCKHVVTHTHTVMYTHIHTVIHTFFTHTYTLLPAQRSKSSHSRTHMRTAMCRVQAPDSFRTCTKTDQRIWQNMTIILVLPLLQCYLYVKERVVYARIIYIVDVVPTHTHSVSGCWTSNVLQPCSSIPSVDSQKSIDTGSY